MFFAHHTSVITTSPSGSFVQVLFSEVGIARELLCKYYFWKW